VRAVVDGQSKWLHLAALEKHLQACGTAAEEKMRLSSALEAGCQSLPAPTAKCTVKVRSMHVPRAES
jgi:hypothetical protein